MGRAALLSCERQAHTGFRIGLPFRINLWRCRDARTHPLHRTRWHDSGASTIAETVELINVLPRPVSLTCFLESLARPLNVQATRSVISLQPAVGARSPRLFVLFGSSLTLSVVPEGEGRAFLELGEFTQDQFTIKGELKFPVMETLDAAAPYRHLATARGTTCGGCHAYEQVAFTINDVPAFQSKGLRPAPRSNVMLDSVRGESETCDAAREPERCALLQAIFKHGEVRAGSFPETLPTIFD